MQKASDSYDREHAHKALKELISFARSFSSNPTVMKQLIEIDYLQSDYGVFPRGESVSIVSNKLLEDTKFASAIMKVTKGEVLNKLPDTYRSDSQFIKDNISEKTKVQNIYRRFTIFNHSIAEK